MLSTLTILLLIAIILAVASLIWDTRLNACAVILVAAALLVR